MYGKPQNVFNSGAWGPQSQRGMPPVQGMSAPNPAALRAMLSAIGQGNQPAAAPWQPPMMNQRMMQTPMFNMGMMQQRMIPQQPQPQQQQQHALQEFVRRGPGVRPLVPRGPTDPMPVAMGQSGPMGAVGHATTGGAGNPMFAPMADGAASGFNASKVRALQTRLMLHQQQQQLLQEQLHHAMAGQGHPASVVPQAGLGVPTPGFAPGVPAGVPHNPMASAGGDAGMAANAAAAVRGMRMLAGMPRQPGMAMSSMPPRPPVARYEAVNTLLSGFARPLKVCRTCNKTHDHVHHLPIGGAVRAVRLSDTTDIRVDICGGCYKWAKRHFAGGHRRCDGGSIRRNCQERLDVARVNGLLLVRWPRGATEEKAIAASEAAAKKLLESRADSKDDASSPKEAAPEPTRRPVTATRSHLAPATSNKKPPKPRARRMGAPGAMSKLLGKSPMVRTMLAPAIDFGAEAGDMPSPANALLPSPSSVASSNNSAKDGAAEPRPAKRRRHKERGSSLEKAGKKKAPVAGRASQPSLLGVLASVACSSSEELDSDTA